MEADTISLRVLNDRLNTSLHTAIEHLTDEQLRFSAPTVDERSIAEVAIHAYDSLHSFVSSVANLSWPATPTIPNTLTDLNTRLNEVHDLVDQMLANLSSEALIENIILPWGQEIAGLGVIADGLAHGLVHTGTIAGIRAIGGFPLPPEE